eukprot:4554088-Pleurochrysis_carterae.AAC.1
MDKARAVEQGVLNGRLGNSATAAGAELFAIFAILRKVQAKQDMEHFGKEKARISIMCGEEEGTCIGNYKWSGFRGYHEYKGNLGTVIFMWIPSHVGIIPNIIADNVAAQEQEATPEGMVTGLISKQ